MAGICLNIGIRENMTYTLGIGDYFIGGNKYPKVFVVGPQRQEAICREETKEEINARLGILIKTYLNSSPEHKPVLKKDYEKARITLLEKNMGFIKDEAMKYSKRGVDTEDLIQEARIGFYRATQDWDHTLGELSTHAGWHIKRRIRDIIHQHRTRIVYVPRYLYELRTGLKNVERQLTDSGLINPSDEEIAVLMRYKSNKVFRRLKPDQVKGIKDLDGDPKSLSKKNHANETTLSHRNTPLEEILGREELDVMKSIIEDERLDRREKQVIIMQYGLYGNDPMNNQEIADKLECSRELIRLIGNEAKRKITFYMQLKGLI